MRKLWGEFIGLPVGKNEEAVVGVIGLGDLAKLALEYWRLV